MCEQLVLPGRLFVGDAKDAIMIGDTTFDLEMAQKAGMPRIGIAHGVHETKALRAFRPEVIVDDLFALAEHLRSL